MFQLTRFTALEVRQKYFNVLKKKNRNLTISDPALQRPTGAQITKSRVQGTEIGVQETENGVQGTVSGPRLETNTVEISQITNAASKVRARSAFGFEFRKLLGYDGGPNKTDELFRERLKTAVNNGMQGPNWYADAPRSLAFRDWGREQRRDMVR